MSTVLDYKNRRYDILALRGAARTGKTLLTQNLFDEDSSGQICTGVQKLAQRWILEFLTETGSMQFLLQRGCDFMTSVRRGRMRTEADVAAEFNFALIDIQRNLLAEETDEMPDDERYNGAELTALAILPGFLQLTVKIMSRAGDSRAVILPISTLA